MTKIRQIPRPLVNLFHMVAFPIYVLCTPVIALIAYVNDRRP